MKTPTYPDRVAHYCDKHFPIHMRVAGAEEVE